MNKAIFWLGAGILIGTYVGYFNEEELDDMYRKSKKTKKKMMKRMNHACDTVCDYLDLD